MLPAAKAVPKELLPILDRPTIQYVVEEAASAGIDDVLLITAPGKDAIERHFQVNRELQGRLQSSGREALLESLNRLIAQVKVHSVHQLQQRGLGDAVAHARPHMRDEPFACLLGDTIFSGGISPAKQLAEAYAEFGTCIIGLEEVAADKVERYGIVGGARVRDGVIRIDTLIEKPAAAQAPSRYAIAARYVLTPAIFDCLARTAPGRGGEIQLTDALRLLLQREQIHGVVLGAARHDVGNPLDWLKTNLLFAARDPALRRQLQPLLRTLLQE